MEMKTTKDGRKHAASVYIHTFINIASVPPPLLFSTSDTTGLEFRTNLPIYSTEDDSLRNMIHNQASYPPGYSVQISGKHTETSRHNNKEEKREVIDFLFRISLSDQLIRSGFTTGVSNAPLEFLPDNKRGYRGTIIPSLNPTIGDEEEAHYLRAWCGKYVADPARIKSFTLRREVRNHDTKKLEQLIRSAISETNYRGHVNVGFPSTHTSLIVYSPGLINQWRMTTWIRWVFYLTFLWIFAWPILFFSTSRYEVVKSVWNYASKPPGEENGRHPTKLSELQFFHKWQSAIKRAALGRMNSHCDFLDESYWAETELADRRGALEARNPTPRPSTGNAFADSAFGLLGQGLQVAQGFNDARGWGRDS
jgi:hypothetical protein